MRFMQCRSRRRQRAFRSHQFSNSPFVLTSPDPGRNSAIQYFVKYCVIKSCKSGKYGFSVSDLSPESKHASFWENLWKIVQRKKRVFYRKMRYNKLEIRLQPSLDAPHSFCVSDLSIHETHEWRTILANQGAWCTFWIAPCLKKKKTVDKLLRKGTIFLPERRRENSVNTWRLRFKSKIVTSAVGLPPPEHCRLRGGVLSAQAGLYIVQVEKSLTLSFGKQGLNLVLWVCR